MYKKTHHWFGRFYLTAMVDENSKQTLLISIQDEKGSMMDSSKIECIHTAVTTVTVEDFLRYQEDAAEYTDFVSAESLEHASVIRLNPDETFKAFNSWVAGIAEARILALVIQTQIESLAKFTYPIAQQLFQFIIKYDFDALTLFIDYIAQECRFEDSYHLPSLNANLHIIRKILPKMQQDQLDKALNLMTESLFPLEILVDLFGQRPVIEHPEAVNLPEYRKLFNHRNWRIRSYVASNPGAVQFVEFNALFNDQNWNVRSKVASNPAAVDIKLYKGFFTETNWHIKQQVAANINAPRLEEYRQFFDKKHWNLWQDVAENIGATRLDEYKILFTSDEWRVRAKIAANPNAVRFEEYRQLFRDPEWHVRQKVALNPKAMRFDEFSMLANDVKKQVRNAFSRTTTRKES